MTDRPLTPQERLLASQLLGSGVFSALQLKHELANVGKEQHPDNVLNIKLPRAQLMGGMDKESSEQTEEHGLVGSGLNFLKTPLTTLLGATSGFKNSAGLYEQMEQKKIQQELDHAEKEYLHTLQRIKTSEASTPLVDALCVGLASSLDPNEKIAKDDDVDIADGSLKRVLMSGLHPLKKPFQPAIDTAAGGGMATTMALALLAYQMRNKGDHESNEVSPPTRIDLQPI